MSFLKSNAKKKPIVKNTKGGSGGLLKKQSKAKLAFLSLAGLLFLTSTGYAGTAYIQLNNRKAKAENWSNLMITSSMQLRYLRACKITQNTIYGVVYRVRIQTYRNSDYTRVVGVSVERPTNGNLQNAGSARNDQWLYGVVQNIEVTASGNNNDVLRVVAYSRTGSYAYASFSDQRTLIRPSSLSEC